MPESTDLILYKKTELGHARHSNSFNLAKKIFAPYPYVKVEGERKFGNRRFD